LATSVAATLAPDQADPPRSSNQDWSDRFIQLQAFLRNNEQSGKEEYIRSKQSTGKIAAQPTNDLTTSPPPRNVMFSTTVLQSSVAANLAPRGVSANNTASRAAISAANLVSSSVSPTNTASTDAISATTQAPNRAHPPRSSNQDRSDRFLRLQAFLRNNEQSGQEEYIRSKQLFYLSSMQFSEIRSLKSFLCSLTRIVVYCSCCIDLIYVVSFG
jgi:hypothetical protein